MFFFKLTSDIYTPYMLESCCTKNNFLYTTHFPPRVGRICFRVRVRLGIEKIVRRRTCHSLLVNAACWPRVGINVVRSVRGPCLDRWSFFSGWLILLDWTAIHFINRSNGSSLARPGCRHGLFNGVCRLRGVPGAVPCLLACY